MTDRPALTRATAGAAALLLALTACGDGGAKAAPTTTPAATPAGADTPEGTLVCEDPAGDLQWSAAQKKAGTAKPLWIDLLWVSWDRDDEGGTVTFKPAGPLPAEPAAGATTYSTTLKQGSLETVVRARLLKGRWTVTSGVRKPVRLKVAPVVEKDSVTLSLPMRVPADGRAVVLGKALSTAAGTEAVVEKTVFRDAECRTEKDRRRLRSRKRVKSYLSWPVVAGAPGSTGRPRTGPTTRRSTGSTPSKTGTGTRSGSRRSGRR
ncbi:hypothetical protein [Actinomadura macrotermitis]|uniref:Lipoprotein n=1 Tax=Actinomadura macrotermitis TaxID=2585200 RepID=A0A7K0BX51_9ACTN|nr:hypothetical protein [Actinomadura macrotermitis]MQY05646.1 hypothetical protein [Actinomadura macrotermitis]